MKLIYKQHKFREDGRVLVVNHNRVIYSTHYRNMGHRQTITDALNKVIKGA